MMQAFSKWYTALDSHDSHDSHDSQAPVSAAGNTYLDVRWPPQPGSKDPNPTCVKILHGDC